LIKVTLPPFNKYVFFHLAKRRSIFSIIPFQIDLALNEAPSRRARYCKVEKRPYKPKC
jgi:hypothetical protein